jgi:catechol-2,3-dioxygenase
MISALRWLALEVKHLDHASTFYREQLALDTVRESESEIALSAGETDLVLRRPSAIPRGGLHTHYALSIPASEYDDWYDQLAESFDLDEHTFGSARSLYFYDPDGNCVELGESDGEESGVHGMFEVVLEVAELARAESFYTDLGMEIVDQGSERRRTRLAADGFALELWEPHLGLADARGGVHVDLGVAVGDPKAALDAVVESVRSVERLDDGIRVRDPDGHFVTFVEG